MPLLNHIFLSCELFPFGMTMSHKEDFQRWKARYEAEGTIFYDRLSEVTYTDRDLSVGDRVIFTNDHGVVFGPHEVLAFGKPVNGRCVYIDSDAYWFADRPEQLTLIEE